MQRPLGIVLISIAQFITGALAIPAGLVALSADPFWFLGPIGFLNPGIAGDRALIMSQLQMLGCFAITIGILLLAAAYGLWTFQGWGRRLSILLEIIGIALPLVERVVLHPVLLRLFQDRQTLSPLIDPLLTGASIVIIFYLFLPRVKALY